MYTVDARGLSCPEPVVLTAEALKANPEGIVVLVDDATPCENVTRYAENQGYKVDRQTEGGEFRLTLKR